MKRPAASTSKDRRRPNSPRHSSGAGGGPAAQLLDRARTSAQQAATQLKSMPRNRLAVLLVGLFLSLLVLWLLLSIIASALQALSGPSLQGEQALIGLEGPPVEIPTEPTPAAAEPASAPPAAEGAITEETGKQIIQNWLSAKAAALGPKYATEELQQVLTEPALSRWQMMAEAQQRNNSHQRYEHSLQIKEVRPNPTNPDRAEVEAQVVEKAQAFEGERETASRNDNLRIRYELVRQDGQWRIMNWEVMR